MAGGTRAVDELTRAEVSFEVHPYEAAADGETYGEAVAARLGVPPDRLFKTLVAEVDGSPVVAIVPVNRRLGLKALARAADGKKARMVDPAEAERLTGYVTGGISPFGRNRALPVYVDASMSGFDTVYVSGGKRGLQIEMAPADLMTLLAARPADLAE